MQVLVYSGGNNQLFNRSRAPENKKKMNLQQHRAMGPKPVGKTKYEPELIVRAFEYYATSRALYSKLTKDFQFPAVRTLQRITSKVAKQDDVQFLKNVFSNIEEKIRKCILMLDEVYVNAALLLHGGDLFGKAQNDPSKLATTILTMMLKCGFGGPEVVAKMLPVAKLDAKFQFSETLSLIENIINVHGDILAVIVDGNRVNQKFFKQFAKVEGKPWLARMKNLNKSLYLFYDYVHLLKCVRNNWLTETNGELEYEWNGEKLVAKWRILRPISYRVGRAVQTIKINRKVSISKAD